MAEGDRGHCLAARGTSLQSKSGGRCGRSRRRSAIAVRDADPSLGVRNPAAKGRSATWTEGEVVRLFKRAWRMAITDLRRLIAVAWSTQLSPGDVRALTASQLAKDASGAVVLYRTRQDREAGRWRA